MEGRYYFGIILMFSLLTFSKGFKCYVCTAEGEASDLCVVSPSQVTGTPSVECNLRYCTIMRQEYLNPPGRIASFHRGCENNPVHLNTMIDNGDFRTYYRACSSDLCNTGNGIQPVNDNTEGAGSNIITLLVPGTGRSSAQTITSHKALMACFLFLLILF